MTTGSILREVYGGEEIQPVHSEGDQPWVFFGRNDAQAETCSPPGDLPDLGIEPVSLKSPALAGGFFITSATALWWKKFQFTKEASVHTVSRNTVSNPPKGSGKVTV